MFLPTTQGPPKRPKVEGWGDTFANLIRNKWQCTSCMVYNDESVLKKCTSCEAPRPGTTDADAATGAVTGSTSDGGASTNAASAAAGGGGGGSSFSFGTGGSSFSFGTGGGDASSDATRGFSFGTASSAETPRPFSFGTSAPTSNSAEGATATTSGFTFGSSTAKSEDSTSPKEKSSKKLRFSFESNPGDAEESKTSTNDESETPATATTSGFSFGCSDKEESKPARRLGDFPLEPLQHLATRKRMRIATLIPNQQQRLDYFRSSLPGDRNFIFNWWCILLCRQWRCFK